MCIQCDVRLGELLPIAEEEAEELRMGSPRKTSTASRDSAREAKKKAGQETRRSSPAYLASAVWHAALVSMVALDLALADYPTILLGAAFARVLLFGESDQVATAHRAAGLEAGFPDTGYSKASAKSPPSAMDLPFEPHRRIHGKWCAHPWCNLDTGASNEPAVTSSWMSATPLLDLIRPYTTRPSALSLIPNTWARKSGTCALWLRATPRSIRPATAHSLLGLTSETSRLRAWAAFTHVHSFESLVQTAWQSHSAVSARRTAMD